MTSIHIISDLFLGFNERASEEHAIPNVDLVIVNGNMGHPKRTMLFLETLCESHPDKIFIYNLGYTERYKTTGGKWVNEVEQAGKIRSIINDSYPKNLYRPLNESTIITTRNHEKFDVMCVFGFPKITSYVGSWEETWYHKHIGSGIIEDFRHPLFKKPKDTSDVEHGKTPTFATLDFINEQHDHETNLIKQWEIQDTHPKILVTHLNPFIDSRNQNLTVSPHLIHLNEGLWVTSNTKVSGVKFLGANLVSNPGRGLEPRSQIVVF